MEEIWMLAFKINLLLGKDEIEEKYVSVFSEAQFQTMLAEEFMCRDMLAHYMNNSLYQRLTSW